MSTTFLSMRPYSPHGGAMSLKEKIQAWHDGKWACLASIFPGILRPRSIGLSRLTHCVVILIVNQSNGLNSDFPLNEAI